MTSLRVGLDVQALQTNSSKRGIGRWIRNFLTAFDRHDSDIQVVLIFSGAGGQISMENLREVQTLAPRAELAIWTNLDLQASPNFDVNGMLDLQSTTWTLFVNSLNLDAILHLGPFEGFDDGTYFEVASSGGLARAAVIFDLIPLRKRSTYLELNLRYKAFYFERLFELRKLDFALTVSKTENDRISKVFGESLNIYCVGTGVQTAESPEFLPKEASDGRRDFIVVGGADRRKNLPLIMEAFEKFTFQSTRNHELHFIGDISIDIRKEILHGSSSDLKKRVKFFGHVSDQELRTHYSRALALIFASEQEGFGLPIVESQMSHLPVLAARSATSLEILGEEYPGYFELNSNDLSRSMVEIAMNEQNLDAYRLATSELSERFSWDQVVESTMHTLRLEIQKIKNSHKKRAFDSSPSPSRPLEIAKQLCRNASYTEQLALVEFLANNTAYLRKKRMYVDVSELSKRNAGTGIQRVVSKLLAQMEVSTTLGYDVCPVEGSQFETGYKHSKFGNSDFQRCNPEIAGNLIEPRSGDVFLGLDLQHHITIRNAGEFAKLQRSGVKVVFILYDLLPIQFPEFWPDGMEVARLHEDLLKSISKSDAVISISRTVESAYLDWRHQNDPDAKQVTGWFHIGSDLGEVGQPQKSPSAQEFGVERYLMVGTIEPRKGHLEVLDAFDLAWSMGSQAELLIVGKRGWLFEEIVGRIEASDYFGSKLFWFENTNDSQLSDLYRESSAVIAASYGEGFGLPIVEAAFYGVNVVARDIEVFQEVAPKGSLFFKDSSELANLIFTKTPLRPRSSQVATWLTWKESLEGLLSTMANLNLIQRSTEGR